LLFSTRLTHFFFFFSLKVFIQTTVETPKEKLQTTEVESWFFVPFEHFKTEFQRKKKTFLERDLRESIPALRYLPFRKLLGLDKVYFPCVELPLDETNVQLWGLTLRLTSELCVALDINNSFCEPPFEGDGWDFKIVIHLSRTLFKRRFFFLYFFFLFFFFKIINWIIHKN